MIEKNALIRHTITHPLIAGLTSLFFLAGCGSLFVKQDGAPDRTLDWNSIPDASPTIEPLSKTGNPSSYVVNGERYYVKSDANNFSESGVASWYGTKFHGNLTSSGEKYDMYKMTAAHKSLPLPSYVSVKNLENDKEIIVKVNDRGPFIDGRIIDLSYAAAHKLDIVRNGTANVSIKVLASPDATNTLSANSATPHNQSSSPRIYFVQLGAFSEILNAENFRRKLISQSIQPIRIRSLDNMDGELHKVQVGPINSVTDLHIMENRLLDLGYTQVYVVTE